LFNVLKKTRKKTRLEFKKENIVCSVANYQTIPHEKKSDLCTKAFFCLTKKKKYINSGKGQEAQSKKKKRVTGSQKKLSYL
jgi:hypothetical protein